MADIRKMLGDLELQYPDFSGHYKDGRGRTQDCFNLPKRERRLETSQAYTFEGEKGKR